MTSSSPSIDAQRQNARDCPDDPEAHVALASALCDAGHNTEAAAAWLAAACAARRIGDETSYRRHLASCVASDDDHLLLFTTPLVDRPGAAEPTTVLVVHDDRRVRDGLRELLSGAGYQVACAADLDETLGVLREIVPDLLLTGPTLSDAPAHAIVAASQRVAPQSATLLLTCAARSEVIPDPLALRPHVDDHLDRPLAPARLLEAVDAAVWRRRHAATPPTIRPEQDARRRFIPDAVRAAMIVAVGYGVILSAAIFLQELSIERAADRAAADSARFGVDPERSYDSLNDVQLRDGIRVAVTIPLHSDIRDFDAEGRLPGNSLALDERYGRIRLEVRDLNGSRLDATAILESLIIIAGDQAAPPSWPPQITMTERATAQRLTLGSQRTEGAVALTIQAAHPRALLEVEGMHVVVTVHGKTFELTPIRSIRRGDDGAN